MATKDEATTTMQYKIREMLFEEMALINEAIMNCKSISTESESVLRLVSAQEALVRTMGML
jgi:hypothetical protein